jgi:DNA-binding transcriptional regulator YiaG
MATKTRKKSQTTKKPKWTVVTYKQIEARRIELGLSKSAMAEALGVTNSTYHNWRRKTTVPHPSQQESIKATMAKLKPGSRATTKTRATTKKRSASSKGTPGSLRTGSGTPRHVGMSTATKASGFTGEHPLYPSDPDSVRSIAQITAAYISAQQKAPSAGSVFKFVRGLRDVLSETPQT